MKSVFYFEPGNNLIVAETMPSYLIKKDGKCVCVDKAVFIQFSDSKAIDHMLTRLDFVLKHCEYIGELE